MKVPRRTSSLARDAGPAVELRTFHVPELEGSAELARVTVIARQLHAHLNSPAALGRIAEVNLPRASSAAVQAVFRDFALALGFVDESKGLFAEMALRPDYYLALDDTGILLEVERGKTIINNMDLLDFWKCHLCSRANYLFLVVPRALRQNDGMSPRNEFEAASRRLKTFFLPRNVTNVRGLFLFGY